MNPAALLELASDPRLIPHLLERAHKAAQGKVDVSTLDAFLPALARGREALNDGQSHLAATIGEPVNADRKSLLDGISAAERALIQALG